MPVDMGERQSTECGMVRFIDRLDRGKRRECFMPVLVVSMIVPCHCNCGKNEGEGSNF